MSLIKEVEIYLNKVLEELDYECECNLMKSQVPSLGQFQINVAMGLAKKYHKNPANNMGSLSTVVGR